jgi:hypothetical protein
MAIHGGEECAALAVDWKPTHALDVEQLSVTPVFRRGSHAAAEDDRRITPRGHLFRGGLDVATNRVGDHVGQRFEELCAGPFASGHHVVRLDVDRAETAADEERPAQCDRRQM